MRIAQTTKRFRKDYAKLQRSGSKNMKKLRNLMELLIDDVILAAKYKDHALQGQWKDFRDCHVEGDWVLIYQLSEDEKGNSIVTFCASDNHSNLFE